MKIAFTLAFIVSLSSAVAQSDYRISGVVNTSENEAVDLAIISLFLSSDSILAKTEFTDKDGSYTITNILPGNYFMLIKQIGFLDYRLDLEINQNKELPVIKLQRDDNFLKEVTVKSNTPFVVRMIDRIVITPDALATNAGSTALEVLEQAPGILLDNNGTIIFKGRSGVAVYINDKPSYLSGSELENYLRTLPAGSIKSIEIIDNPPARYEAAGNAGIININVKRGSIKGLYGNTTVSYRRSRYNGSNNSFNLNYNRSKISLYSNIYAGFWENFQDLNINRYYLNENNITQSSFQQNSFNNRNGQYLNGKIGLDFYPSEKTIIGISYKGVTSPSNRKIDNTALTSDASGNLLQRVVADNLSETTFLSNLGSFYVSQTLDTLGSKLSFDADFVQYASSNDQLFKNFQYNPDNFLLNQNQINGEIPSEIRILAAKTDLTKTLKEGAKFEAGLKSAFTKTDNEAIYSTTINEITTPDYGLSNRFLYNEWINAAYVNYKFSVGKVGLQLGLRGEATRFEGNQLGNVETPDTNFTRSYGSLFPTLYAFTKLDTAGRHGLNFSYGRRINRPYFQDLNPFISPLDQFTFYTGNPNLLPTFSHNLSLSHSFNNFLNTTISYSKTIDGIQETLEIRNEIYYSRPGNIASSQFLSLSLDGSYSVTPWYKINGYAECALVRFDSQLYTEQLNSRGTNVYVSLTNNFQLKKGWKFDLSGRYLNDHVSSQLLIEGYAVLNFGMQKTIFNGKGNVKLSASDLFYSRVGNGIINNLNQTNADWNSTFDSRSIRASFSMRFGKSAFNKEKYSGSGSESEQQRVKG